jgi:hypothetical protein
MMTEAQLAERNSQSGEARAVAARRAVQRVAFVSGGMGGIGTAVCRRW